VTQRFTGQVRDQETGLDFFNARYFGSAIGRFTSVDPENAGADLYNPQSWNGYGYVANNPLAYVDPDGRSFLTEMWNTLSAYFGHGGGPSADFSVTGYGVGDINTFDASRYSLFFGSLGGISRGGGSGGGGGTTGGGGGSQSSGKGQQTQKFGPPERGTCYSLAAGQTSSEGFLSWYMGVGNALQMTDLWAVGVGPTETDFGPDSVASKEMMSAYGLSSNVKGFLAGGALSGNQTFGLSGLWSTGLNPTGQFVGSYHWNMSRGDGNLNITLTNSTTAWSAFYHPRFLNPNPQTRTGWRPVGRVNQTFHVTVPCS
jgi:RHS repeat-associated protein